MSDLVTLSKRYLAESWSQIVDAGLAVPAVLVAQRDAPLPNEPVFATMQFTPLDQRGRPDYSYENFEDHDVVERLTNANEYRLALNIYRAYEAAPIDYAEKFRMYLMTSEAYLLLQRFGFGLGRVSSAMDLSDMQRGQWEERVRLEIHFSAKTEYIVTLPAIESVEITGNVIADGETYNVRVSNV